MAAMNTQDSTVLNCKRNAVIGAGAIAFAGRDSKRVSSSFLSSAFSIIRIIQGR